MRSNFARALAFGLFSLLLCVIIGFATQRWLPINISLEPAARAAQPSSSAPIKLDDKTSRAGLIESYGRLPLRFEANRGQTDARVKFISRGAGYSLFLTGDEAALQLRIADSGLRIPESTPYGSLTLNPVFGIELLLPRSGF
ncbi:MAG: hypothetical protein ACREBD_09650 [Blastocatellia bacterium]